MKLVFIDFEDSFTNNILSYLSDTFEIEIINYQDINQDVFTDSNIILGPGPGHPDEYISFFKTKNIKLANCLKRSRRVLGICLGHQLVFSSLYNVRIVRSLFPMHGQGVMIKEVGHSLDFIKLEKLVGQKLQRYNSLTVELDELFHCRHPEVRVILDTNDEVLLGHLPQAILTMQIHPESVGTSCSNILFDAINKFFR